MATRLRLTELIPSIAEAFLADQIGVGHALEIAKLPQSEQQRAFDAAFRTVWSGSKENRVLLPVRELTAWIEQNILLSLDSVPFDKSDETLMPEAGSCTNCPKRTGYNTLLFGEATKDSCTDGDLLQRQARQAYRTADCGETQAGTDHDRIRNTRQRCRARTQPLRCAESLSQERQVQSTALALSEAVQANELRPLWWTARNAAMS